MERWSECRELFDYKKKIILESFKIMDNLF